MLGLVIILSVCVVFLSVALFLSAKQIDSYESIKNAQAKIISLQIDEINSLHTHVNELVKTR